MHVCMCVCVCMCVYVCVYVCVHGRCVRCDGGLQGAVHGLGDVALPTAPRASLGATSNLLLLFCSDCVWLCMVVYGCVWLCVCVRVCVCVCVSRHTPRC